MDRQARLGQKPKGRLSFKLGLPFLLITVVMASVVAYMVRRSYDFQIQSAQERQRQASTRASFQVSSYVNQFRAQLDDAASGLVYASRDPAQQRDWLERVQRAHSPFYELAVTDATGQETSRKIWLVPEYLTVLREQSVAPAVETALREQFYLGEVYISDKYRSPFVQMAVPVYDVDGLITGTLVAEVDLSQLWVVVKDLQVGPAGYAYVVDESGRLIAYRESELVQGPVIELPLVASVPSVESFLSQRAESQRMEMQPSGLLCVLRQQCEPVLAYHRPIEGASWGVIIEQPISVAYAEANRLRTLALGLVALAIAIWVVSVWGIRRYVLYPIHLLGRGAAALAGGALTERISIATGDEIETLADEFNTMAASLQASQVQLEEYAHTLEQRVVERTAELEQRAVQLRTSSQVARQVTSILDLDELLAQVVTLIQARFGYYFVGVWLLSDNKDRIVLRAGTGRDDENLPKPGSTISTDESGIIVEVCHTGQARSVDDVCKMDDCHRVDAALMVHSELALPLHMAEKTSGVLNILSDRPDAFPSEDRLVLQTLADQIAIAIRNAQLYKAEQRRRRLAESLEQAGRDMSSSLDLRQTPGRVLEKLSDVVPYERGSVMLQYGDVMRIVAQRGFPDDQQARDLLVPIRQGDIFQQMAASARPMLVDDVTREPGWRQVEWLPVNLSWMGVPLIAQGKPIGMISFTRPQAAAFTSEDATLASTFAGQAAIALENARLYDELNHAYRTLERLDKTKSDFINVAAHELRTPLTVIKGYTQVLETMPVLKTDESAQPLLEGILAGVARLHEIVNSMLDVTKIDSQTLTLRRAPTALVTLIERAHLEFKPALQERHLTFEMVGMQDLPPVHADPDLLYKVFYHLLVNAIKYTPDGGSITISGQALPGQDGPAEVQIVVSDTGIGIDPANHSLIFEKFYQTGEVAVHSSGRTKFKGGGPGLGLAIARGIVIAHGGQIWVESEAYDEARCPGSRFYVRLPVM